MFEKTSYAHPGASSTSSGIKACGNMLLLTAIFAEASDILRLDRIATADIPTRGGINLDASADTLDTNAHTQNATANPPESRWRGRMQT